MRLFVAVDVAEELKPKIIHIQKKLAQSADIKLVEPENLHFTMKFLGEVNDQDLSYIESSLKSAVADFKQFSVNIKGMGIFPNQNYLGEQNSLRSQRVSLFEDIRVVWLGTNSSELEQLQKSIDKSLSDRFAPEKNAISHLTLARVRTFQKEIIEFVKSHEVIDVGLMKVSCVKLKQSFLSRQGPTYEDVKVFELSI